MSRGCHLREKLMGGTYGNSGNFTLEYTNNGGANWQLISSSVSGSARHYVLNPGPTTTTENAKILVEMVFQMRVRLHLLI